MLPKPIQGVVYFIIDNLAVWLYAPLQALDRMLPAPIQKAYRKVVFEIPLKLMGRQIYHRFKFRDALFKPITRLIYRAELPKSGTVVQVGASSGRETCRFANAVGPTGQVIAVEPVPSNQALLEEELKRQGVTHVRVVKCGAWNTKTTLLFYTAGPKENRIADLNSETVEFERHGTRVDIGPDYFENSETLNVDTIANMVGPDTQVDFLLIEVNGAELEALKGAEAILPNIKQIAVRGHVELDGEPLKIPLEAYLREHGFATEVIQEDIVIGRAQG
ncbi:MAG: FkbM family methyltransferase [Verrucomicrobiota bacterium]